MKRIIFPLFMIIMVSVVAFMLPVTAISAAAADKPIEINYVSFLPKTHETMEACDKNWKEVEKRAQGRIKFINKGGPESINIFGQAMAVYTGATDMVFTTPAFMGKLAKGTTMMTLTALPVSKHRESGLYDYLNEVYNSKANMQFIQMFPRKMGTAFVVLSKEKINGLADLKGKSMRGGDFIDSMAKLLGVNTVALKHYEDYSAMERGVVDLSMMTIESMVQFRLHEVGKYLIQPPFASAPMSWFMNLKKWKSIPPDLQNLILDTLYELADETEAQYQVVTDKKYAEMKANGVEIIQLQGKDLEIWTKDMERAIYEYYLKDDPEIAKKVYELSH